jgi:hypothetical protein
MGGIILALVEAVDPDISASISKADISRALYPVDAMWYASDVEVGVYRRAVVGNPYIYSLPRLDLLLHATPSTPR